MDIKIPFTTAVHRYSPQISGIDKKKGSVKLERRTNDKAVQLSTNFKITENGPVVKLTMTGCPISRTYNPFKLRSQKYHHNFESDNQTLNYWVLMLRNPQEVKRAIIHGIADCLRGSIWQLISGGRELLLANPGIYPLLLSSEESESEVFIVNDLRRTITSDDFFLARNEATQRSLHKVLKAYSVYNKDVGYTQGMNFIAAMILHYMSEEEAFLVMVAVLKGAEKKPLRGLYGDDFPLLHECFCQFAMLVKEVLPRVGKHFEEQKITPLMYGSRWFMTVFSTDLPMPLVVRIWDIFLCEGIKTVFSVGLALLKQFEKYLLKLPLDGLLQFLRCFPEEKLDLDILIPLASTIMEMIEVM